MTKPAITKRVTKGSALTYDELDTNFQNLDDATITVTGDTGSIVNNLNDSFKIAGGTALTSSVSGTTLTVNLDNTTVSPGYYTSANITVDAQGRITAAVNGDSSPDRLTSGIYNLVYSDNGTTGTLTAHHAFTLATNNNGNIVLAPGGTGHVQIDSLIFPTTIGDLGQSLMSDGTGNLEWGAPGGIRAVSPTQTWSSGTFTSGSWYSWDGSYDVNWINYQTGNNVYLSVNKGTQNIGRKYTLIFYKTGAGTISFGEQGGWISGTTISGTGTFVVDIEFYSSSIHYITIR